MIAVKVRDQKSIDAFNTASLRRSRDAVRVASTEPRVARIDQQTLTGRRDHQSRLAAFHIDEINVKRFGRLRGACEEQEDTKLADTTHVAMLPWYLPAYVEVQSRIPRRPQSSGNLRVG